MKKEDLLNKCKLRNNLEGLLLIKFSEILNSSTSPNILSINKLKINFKHLDFVRKPLFICWEKNSPLDYKILNLILFSLILH